MVSISASSVVEKRTSPPGFTAAVATGVPVRLPHQLDRLNPIGASTMNPYRSAKSVVPSNRICCSGVMFRPCRSTTRGAGFCGS